MALDGDPTARIRENTTQMKQMFDDMQARHKLAALMQVLEQFDIGIPADVIADIGAGNPVQAHAKLQEFARQQAA